MRNADDAGFANKDKELGNGHCSCSDAVARQGGDALSYRNSQISHVAAGPGGSLCDAAYHLVTSHLRFVAKIAMRYRGYGLPIADIISEGNVGLMRAVKRFEPERGYRLATYAMWWIKASIQEYILRSWSLVKMGTSAAQKKLFFRLRRTKAEISALEDGDLRPEHTAMIAKRLGVNENDVVDMNRRLGGDVSLNTLVHADEAGEAQDWLVDPASSPEAVYADQEEVKQRRQALTGALEVLNTRERGIFEARFLSEPAVRLEELATRFGISRERVRQIEIRAFEKVQATVCARQAKGCTTPRSNRGEEMTAEGQRQCLEGDKPSC